MLTVFAMLYQVGDLNRLQCPHGLFQHYRRRTVPPLAEPVDVPRNHRLFRQRRFNLSGYPAGGDGTPKGALMFCASTSHLTTISLNRDAGAFCHSLTGMIFSPSSE